MVISSFVVLTRFELIFFLFVWIYFEFFKIHITPRKIILNDGKGGAGSGSEITEIPKHFLIMETKKSLIILLIAKEVSKFTRRRIKVFFTRNTCWH